MIILNGVIVIFAPFFPNTISAINESATDIEDTYGDYAQINAIDVIVKTLITGGVIFGIATIISIITRNPVFIGVGAFVGIFIGLWGSISEPITTTLDTYSPTIGLSIYNLFMIIFGIIIVLSTVEILSGQTGVDT